MSFGGSFGWSLNEIECFRIFGHTNAKSDEFVALLKKAEQEAAWDERVRADKALRNSMMSPELRDPPEHSGIPLMGFA